MLKSFRFPTDDVKNMNSLKHILSWILIQLKYLTLEYSWFYRGVY